MTTKICPCCGEEFQPSRYHPEQRVCSSKPCQQKRRTEYRRQKLMEDADYRETCRNSRANWRRNHPNYMKEYRAATRRHDPTRPPS